MATLAITILKNDIAEDGKTTVYLRFTHKGKPKYLSLKQRVKPEHFKPDAKSGSFVLPNSPHAARVNYLLKTELTNANKVLLDMEMERVVLNFDNFLARFRPLSDSKFADWSLSKIEKEVKEKVLSEASADVYRYAVKKFVKVVGDLRIVEIDADIIKKFKEKVSAENSENTASTYLKSLHRFYTDLVENHNVRDNKPFKLVTMEGSLPEKKANLDTDEENRMFDLWYRYKAGLTNEFTESTFYEDLRKYCFCLKTGLRHSDVDDLQFKHLVTENIEDVEVWFIQKTRIKGSKRINSKKKTLLIPILPEAFDLIDFDRMESPESFVFWPSTEKVYNSRLKHFAAAVGITKHITTHTARHTFSERLKEHGKSDGEIAHLLGNTKEVTRTYYAQGTKLALLNMITTNSKLSEEEMRQPIIYPDVTHSRTNTLRLNMIALRKKRGKEPVEMCKLIGEKGISLSQYTRFEDGKTNMSINYVMDFCRIFGITLADLEKGNF